MAKCVADSTLGTAPDTYLYTLAQSRNLFAAIGSDDSLRLFDITLKSPKAVRGAHTGIACLTSQGDYFVSAGRDGLIRYWDARTTSKSLEIAEPKGNGFSSISCHDHYIAAGTESAKEGLGDVSVLLYDTRKASTPLRNYSESHTDTITQLAFHPTQPNVLLSASTDGLVSFFDVDIAEEEDALQSVLNPRAAVHCAGFLSPTEVYVATTDEHISIHSLNESDDRDILEFGDVREKLDCMYIVTTVNDEQPVLVCGHNVKQTLSLVQLDKSRSYDFGARIELPGAHGEEVVRDVLLLSGEKKAISCGEDGHVKVWTLTSD